MNQKITFATILVAFSIFFICFTNAFPIELSPRYEAGFVDFTNAVTGRITFQQIPGNVIRIIGQFNSGITNTGKYEIKIPGLKKRLIPGTLPFFYEVEGKTINFFIGKKVKIFRNGKVLEQESIEPIG
ncbi:hypothetical protein Glove_196g88 [Diversispora epigaea]|uniref:Uncharacterized protein n=1 Tax=Diversispora epigaea TaxID=1348612 RepID=A0A397IKV2_9GLOM|nr:hypothetical protein Glove_196g88 [Diversispora epigaea]